MDHPELTRTYHWVMRTEGALGPDFDAAMAEMNALSREDRLALFRYIQAEWESTRSGGR